jgi:hypothetical protein
MSSNMMRAARNVAAADYIRDVIQSLDDRRDKYNAEATVRLFRALITNLVGIETFVLRYVNPSAEPVNSSTHPSDDKEFVVKVKEQLRLIEAEQIRIQPQELWAEFTTLIAGAIRLLQSVYDAIDRHHDHIRERQAERERAAANVDTTDDDSSEG